MTTFISYTQFIVMLILKHSIISISRISELKAEAQHVMQKRHNLYDALVKTGVVIFLLLTSKIVLLFRLQG